MKRVIDISVIFLATALLVYFSFSTYMGAKELEQINKEYYEAQTNIVDLVKRRFDSIVNSLSFGTIDKNRSDAKRLEELKVKAIELKSLNKKQLIWLGVVSVAIILTYFILSLESYALLLGLASLVTLLFGIFTPILMIVIHKNIDYLGDIVLSFESKTIFATITHLYSNGNYPVAVAILLFSIIVPLIKSLSMIVVILWRHFFVAAKVVKFFKHLGKWSMVDVFVVALLLVYLSAGSSENSYSQIESGLYTFMIYVIFSIITSIVVELVLQGSVEGRKG